jgi:hypothetical protein
MALLENGLKGLIPNVLAGVGIAIAAPVLLPAVAAGLRPVAKTLIRGGLYVTDAAREVFGEATQRVSDLLAEVRAEGCGVGTEPRQEGGA